MDELFSRPKRPRPGAILKKLRNSRVATMCKHINVTIYEIGTWSTSHTKENGEWTHYNQPGDYDHMIDVICDDCGFQGRYNRYKAPAWVKKLIDELSELELPL